MEDKKKRLIIRIVKRELVDYGRDKIFELKTNTQYSKEFSISITSFKNILKNLEKEKRDYRSKQIRHQTGKKVLGIRVSMG
ncbi:MAG: hypothetical protein Q7S74_03795 [Nanoarchaeota archaeon]|nr:hypothetical protein [Nanoarchaeota archaeon]